MSIIESAETWVRGHTTETAVGVFVVGGVLLYALSRGSSSAAQPANADPNALNLNQLYSEQLQASTQQAQINAQSAQVSAGVATAYAGYNNAQALATIQADTQLGQTNSNNQLADIQSQDSLQLGESQLQANVDQTTVNDQYAYATTNSNNQAQTASQAIIANEQDTISNNSALTTISVSAENAQTQQTIAAYQAQAAEAQSEANAAIASSNANASVSNNTTNALGNAFGGVLKLF